MVHTTDNLKNYLRIRQAAEILGVSTNTLRNWTRGGKIKSYRNPMNGYRLFRKEDLEALLDGISRSNQSEDH